MLGFAGWYNAHNAYTSFMFYFPFNLLIWVGPLLYFYFLSLTNSDFRLQRRHWPHAILPLLWTALIIGKAVWDFTQYYPFEIIESTQYGTKGPTAEWDKHPAVELAGYLSFAFYMVLTVRAFRSYQSYIRAQFSDQDSLSFTWLRHLIIGFSVGILIFLVFQLIAVGRMEGNTFMFEWYAYLGLGVVNYYLSISAYFARTRLQEKLHFEPQASPTPLPARDFPDLPQWKAKLLDWMENEQPYLDPELSLPDLAKKLNTNASILSRVINEGTGQHFNDFVNEYRIRYFENCIRQGRQETQTLLGIALDCGFNSKATFNRAFKKYKGMTPKSYLDGLKK